MSDQGFDFGPPPPKREARRFEPPPWEREQFERQAREQAEREAAAQEARARVLAEEEAARAADRQTENPSATGGAEVGGPVAVMAAMVPQPETGAAAGDAEPTAPAYATEVDEKQVAIMMLGLRAEEPAALESAWVINLAAGSVVVLVGFAVGVWGGAALARPGLPPAGTLGGVVLLGFGLGFMGIGAWLIFKALRQRGVF